MEMTFTPKRQSCKNANHAVMLVAVMLVAVIPVTSRFPIL
jgi:hypothetical protein